VIGSLSIVNTNPGGVVVWASRTDWQPTANDPHSTAPGTGTFNVSCLSTCTGGDITNLSYQATPVGPQLTLTPGQLGLVKDIDVTQAPLLSFSPSNPNPGATGLDMFITISGTPIDLRLITLGPSAGTTNCAGVTTVGATCSPTITIPAGQPGAGATFVSPFILTYNGIVNGAPRTGVQLAVGGTATDGSNNVSNWTGAFTTQVNFTPEQIQSMINSDKSISSSYSGTFTANFNPVPEPQTTALVLGGLLVLLGKVGMRRLNRSSR
jgi:hypothetical protein